mmetsp:Transcript_25498/g.53712  ORF Transcript_25498/g.53712 Transcript_25498/m.53712 type:complete len:506 (+) Transcript_25498:364-1881(+)
MAPNRSSVVRRPRSNARKPTVRAGMAVGVGVISVLAMVANWTLTRGFAASYLDRWVSTTTSTTTAPVVAPLSAMAEAFSNLEVFLCVHPGNRGVPLADGDGIFGLVELKETVARTLLFFWPRDRYPLKVTVVLDDTTYSSEEDRTNLIAEVRSFFLPGNGINNNINNNINNGINDNNNNHDDTVSQHKPNSKPNSDDVRVSVGFNSRTNKTLYGPGWYIQQLIMLWADNFTESEYIGFVDDDTMFTSAINPYDLFDQHGRPRVVVQAAGGTRLQDTTYNQASQHAFQRPPRLYSMTYFPVVIKRKHFALLRQHLLAIHPEHSVFDEFFTAHVFRGPDNTVPQPVCQFCLLADYVYEAHRSEYSWHFETPSTTYPIEFATPEMYQPFPRVSIHPSYMFMAVKRPRASKTVAGRKDQTSRIMREGYCHSLVVDWKNKNNSIDHDRCQKFLPKDEVPVLDIRGSWKFEQYPSPWIDHPNITVAHTERRKHAIERVWDLHELEHVLFVA